MEYQETINTWKEYPHVLTMLTRDNYNVPQGKTFMQKFLEGAYSYLISCLGFAAIQRVGTHMLRVASAVNQIIQRVRPARSALTEARSILVDVRLRSVWRAMAANSKISRAGITLTRDFWCAGRDEEALTASSPP